MEVLNTECSEAITRDCLPELWNACRADRDPEARTRLIEFYLPFARMLAAKAFARRTSAELEFEDFFQYASVGLIEAVDRYAPEQGAKFETFAGLRITGAILNGIQSISEKQEQIRARQRIVSDRVNSMKDTLPAGEDSEDLFGFLAEMAIGLAIGFALEDSGMFQVEEPAYPDNAYQGFELRQLRDHIMKRMESLPVNEGRVLRYHYFQQLGFEEISRMLGVTKGRISQIHKSALNRLRGALRRDDALDVLC